MEINQPEGQTYDSPNVRYAVRLVADQECEVRADGDQYSIKAKPDDAPAILLRSCVAERPRRLQERSYRHQAYEAVQSAQR